MSERSLSTGLPYIPSIMTLIFLSLKVRMQLHVSVWWDSLSSFLKQKKPGATVTVAGLGKESISDQNYICKN